MPMYAANNANANRAPPPLVAEGGNTSNQRPAGVVPPMNAPLSYASATQQGVEHGFMWKLMPPREKRKPRRKKFTTGKSVDTPSLAGVNIRPVDVFVTRLPPTCTVDNVQELVTSNTNVEVKVRKLETNHDDYFSSFHVSGMCNDPDKLLDPVLWPDNCLFRKWFPQKRNRSLTTGAAADLQNDHGGG